MYAHFAVELRERVDAAETDVAVQRLCGHDGVFRRHVVQGFHLQLLQFLHEWLSYDQILYVFEGVQLSGVELGMNDVPDDVTGEWCVDGL